MFLNEKFFTYVLKTDFYVPRENFRATKIVILKF